MSIKNEILTRLITATLFIVAAIFNFLTPNKIAKIAGVCFLVATIFFCFSAFNKRKSKNKN